MPISVGVPRLFTAIVLFAACTSASTAQSGTAYKIPTRQVPRLVMNTVVTDSQMYRPARLGTMYRYGSGDSQRDVFIYPKSWPSPQEQAKYFIDATEVAKKRNDIASYSIESNNSFSIHVRGDEILGHEVVLRMNSKAGPLNSYFAVLSLPDEYVKVRITREAALNEPNTRGFAEAWVAAYLAGPTR